MVFLSYPSCGISLLEHFGFFSGGWDDSPLWNADFSVDDIWPL